MKEGAGFTLSAVLLEEGLSRLKLLSVESEESPSSFLMSSSSLSRLTPLTSLTDFDSKPNEGTDAALDLDLKATSGPLGDPAEAAAVSVLSTATATLLLRKRFPFWLSSVLDCVESSTGAPRDWATTGGGENPMSEVRLWAGIGPSLVCS